MPAGTYEMTADLKAAAMKKLELLGLEPPTSRPSSKLRRLADAAPISGIVVTKLALRGAEVNPGYHSLLAGQPQRVWIKVDIYEDDLSRVYTARV